MVLYNIQEFKKLGLSRIAAILSRLYYRFSGLDHLFQITFVIRISRIGTRSTDLM